MSAKPKSQDPAEVVEEFIKNRLSWMAYADVIRREETFPAVAAEAETIVALSKKPHFGPKDVLAHFAEFKVPEYLQVAANGGGFANYLVSLGLAQPFNIVFFQMTQLGNDVASDLNSRFEFGASERPDPRDVIECVRGAAMNRSIGIAPPVLAKA